MAAFPSAPTYATPAEMAAAFAPAVKRGPSLRDCVLDLEVLVDTVESLEPADLSPELREELGRDLCEAIAGTKAKVDRTAAVLAHFEACAALASAESKRLAARAAFYDRQGDRLSNYVIATIAASKLKKLDGHTSTLAIRACPPSVVIDPGAVVPAEFLRQPAPPAPAPDKAKLKAALASGAVIDGCSLQQSVRLVRS